MYLSDLILEGADLRVRFRQILDAIQATRGIDADEALEIVSHSDPTNGKYAEWILRLIKTEQVRGLEDAKRVNDALGQFTNLKRRKGLPIEKDILKYETLLQLEQTVEPYAKKKKKKSGIIEDPTELPGVKYLGKVRDLDIYVVTEAKSLGILGRGTRWCTREGYDVNNTTAADYLKEGPVYNVRKNGKPYAQISHDLSQAMDPNDMEIKDDELLISIAKKANNPVTYAYLAKHLEKRLPEYESLIASSPKAIRVYSCDVLKGRWKAVESRILKNPKAAMDYWQDHWVNVHYNHDPKTRGETDSRWPEAERVFARNGYAAAKYIAATGYLSSELVRKVVRSSSGVATMAEEMRKLREREKADKKHLEEIYYRRKHQYTTGIETYRKAPEQHEEDMRLLKKIRERAELLKQLEQYFPRGRWKKLEQRLDDADDIIVYLASLPDGVKAPELVEKMFELGVEKIRKWNRGDFHDYCVKTGDDKSYDRFMGELLDRDEIESAIDFSEPSWRLSGRSNTGTRRSQQLEEYLFRNAAPDSDFNSSANLAHFISYALKFYNRSKNKPEDNRDIPDDLIKKVVIILDMWDEIPNNPEGLEWDLSQLLVALGPRPWVKKFLEKHGMFVRDYRAEREDLAQFDYEFEDVRELRPEAFYHLAERGGRLDPEKEAQLWAFPNKLRRYLSGLMNHGDMNSAEDTHIAFTERELKFINKDAELSQLLADMWNPSGTQLKNIKWLLKANPTNFANFDGLTQARSVTIDGVVYPSSLSYIFDLPDERELSTIASNALDVNDDTELPYRVGSTLNRMGFNTTFEGMKDEIIPVATAISNAIPDESKAFYQAAYPHIPDYQKNRMAGAFPFFDYFMGVKPIEELPAAVAGYRAEKEEEENKDKTKKKKPRHRYLTLTDELLKYIVDNRKVGLAVAVLRQDRSYEGAIALERLAPFLASLSLEEAGNLADEIREFYRKSAPQFRHPSTRTGRGTVNRVSLTLIKQEHGINGIYAKLGKPLPEPDWLDMDWNYMAAEFFMDDEEWKQKREQERERKWQIDRERAEQRRLRTIDRRYDWVDGRPPLSRDDEPPETDKYGNPLY